MALLVAAATWGVVRFAAKAKATEPYRHALSVARADPRVTEHLGSPLDDGFMPMGGLGTSPDSHGVGFAVSVSGPKAGGMLMVAAVREEPGWDYLMLQVQLDDGRVIDLLRPGTEPAVPDKDRS